MSAILKQNAVDIANAFEKYGLWKSGSSGGSVSAEIKELWSGQQSTSGTLTLLDDYTNYDVIVSQMEPLENYPTQQSYAFMLKGGVCLTGGMCENTQYIAQYRLMNWNGTSVYFSRDTNPSGWNVTLKKIYGIKFHNEIHEYSTEEKVVGKWIDGKPIYEKVITTNHFIATGDSWYTTDIDFNKSCLECKMITIDGIGYPAIATTDNGKLIIMYFRPGRLTFNTIIIKYIRDV